MPNTDVEPLWHEHRHLGIQPCLVVLYSLRVGDHVIDTGRVVDFQV